MSEFSIRPVRVEDVRDLEEALLRETAETHDNPWSGEPDPDALHLGGYRDGVLVGCATILRQRIPGSAEQHAWRIKGVAIEHGHRGFGLGGMMMRRLLEHAGARGARIAWCRVPAGAYGFFEHLGFRRAGDPFEDPSGGPQYMMAARFASRG